MHPSEGEKRFEEVRKLVETRHPQCRVTSIKEYSRASYSPVMVKTLSDVGQYVLARLSTEFTVEAVSLVPNWPGYTYEIALDTSGCLRIVKETTVLTYRYLEG